MKYSTARPGRVFVLRLEHGEILHETVERFARAKKIRAGTVIALGGADQGSRLVVGPERARGRPVKPMELVLSGVHELAGVGAIFPNARGEPLLHLHAACGRKGLTRTGCVRRGVRTWHVLEVVISELTGSPARRMPDPDTGFELLEPRRSIDEVAHAEARRTRRSIDEVAHAEPWRSRRG